MLRGVGVCGGRTRGTGAKGWRSRLGGGPLECPGRKVDVDEGVDVREGASGGGRWMDVSSIDESFILESLMRDVYMESRMVNDDAVRLALDDVWEDEESLLVEIGRAHV